MTDTDKINIASSQNVFEWSSFRMDARSKSSTLVLKCHVDSRLFKATPDVDHPPFIYATDFCLVDTTLHDNPDLVIDWFKPGIFGCHWCLLVQKVNGFMCMMR